MCNCYIEQILLFFAVVSNILLLVDRFEVDFPFTRIKYIEYDDGHYKGQVRAGELEGYGTFLYKTGEKYDGYWKASKRHGHGVYSFPDGSKYDGEWRENNLNGVKGTFSSSNAGKYIGFWKGNQRHGQGRYIFPNNSSYYGEWTEGYMDGMGLLQYSDSRTEFNGLFSKGEIQGDRGVYTYLDLKKSIEGSVEDAKVKYRWKPNGGDGVYSFPNEHEEDDEKNIKYDHGATYRGQLSNNKRDGYGVMKYPDGVYSGHWREDKRHGHGKIQYKNGKMYEGKWENDKMAGGICKYSHHKSYECFF